MAVVVEYAAYALVAFLALGLGGLVLLAAIRLVGRDTRVVRITEWTSFDALGAQLDDEQRAEFAAIVADLDDVRRTGKRLVREEGR